MDESLLSGVGSINSSCLGGYAYNETITAFEFEFPFFRLFPHSPTSVISVRVISHFASSLNTTGANLVAVLEIDELFFLSVSSGKVGSSMNA